MMDNHKDDATEAFTVLVQDTMIHHYKILRRIGLGGMGEVYLALDTRLNREVALKFLGARFYDDRAFLDRFKQEAQSAAQINHPNIITIYETNEINNRPYIAMEHISGKTLEECIHNKVLNLNEKIEIVRQICEGLRAAHERELIHQDLKPGNIMITVSGRVIILDFGLAKRMRVDTVDREGRIEGTPMYMSPEQISGQKLNYSTDLFSLGVTLYELFTGQKPFTGEDMSQVIYSILHEEPVPPREINEEIPEWINAMILKLLAKEYINRFQNIDTVLEYIDYSIEQDWNKSDIGKYKIRKKSVTLIDLKNLSGDDSWNYFCVGFTEDLIREISQRTDLVVSYEPAFQKTNNITEIFDRCRSDFVITGNLMKWQNTIKLGLSIFAEKGKNLLLGQNYEGPSEEMFRIMGEATRETTSVLARASGASLYQVEDRISTDITAYDYYLKGRNYYNSNKPEDLNFAVRMFEKALEIDKDFALAHTGLADIHISQYMSYYDHSPKQLERAKLETEKALQMNPNLPEAHRSLGRYYMFCGDLENAEKAFLKCIEIAPKNFIGYRTLAWLKDWQGDDEASMVWAKKALELAPTDLETLLLISLLYLDMGKYTLSMATLQRAIELGPDYGRAYYLLGTVYKKLGVIDLALENYLLAIKYEGEVNGYIDAGYAYMLLEDYQKANSMFDKSIERNFLPYIACYYKGFIKKVEKDTEQANVFFEKAITLADAQIDKNDAGEISIGYKILSMIMLGHSEKAELLLSQNPNFSPQKGESLYLTARIYSLLGNKEKAELYKKLALEEHACPSAKELAIDPHFSDNILKLLLK